MCGGVCPTPFFVTCEQGEGGSKEGDTAKNSPLWILALSRVQIGQSSVAPDAFRRRPNRNVDIRTLRQPQST